MKNRYKMEICILNKYKSQLDMYVYAVIKQDLPISKLRFVLCKKELNRKEFDSNLIYINMRVTELQEKYGKL